MSKQLIEQLAKEHFPGLKSQRKWISTNAPDKRGLAKGHEIDVFTIDATAEQLEAFAKSYQAAAPIVSELVAYRWKPKKNVIWIYNPDDSFIDTIKNDPDVDIEPLYTHAQPLEKPTSDNVPVDLDVLQFTEYGIVPDDYKNQASGYR
ncbi:MAG TPA: hypothetical protein VL943_07150, partial [Niabella sp.]|nr:hypothetical protein [Niabella sp.]